VVATTLKTSTSWLKRLIEHKQYVSFTCNGLPYREFEGTLVHVTDTFVAVREDDDFEWDGIQVVAREHLGKIEVGPTEKFRRQILEQNGQLAKLKAPAWLFACDTFQDVMQQLHRRKMWIDVTIVHRRTRYFGLGPIMEVEEAGATIRNIYSEGTWDKQDWPVDFKYLRRLNFGDRYTRHFSRFAEALEKS